MGMNVRRVETESSVWLFDTDLQQYLRLPKIEKPTPTAIPYTGAWEPYEEVRNIQKGDDYYLMIIRPVPFGQGQFRLSGVVVSDSDGDLTQETAPG